MCARRGGPVAPPALVRLPQPGLGTAERLQLLVTSCHMEGSYAHLLVGGRALWCRGVLYCFCFSMEFVRHIKSSDLLFRMCPTC